MPNDLLYDESGGIGLWSIDQRLREFGAVLDVEAEAGRGTRAMLILPRSVAQEVAESFALRE